MHPPQTPTSSPIPWWRRPFGIRRHTGPAGRIGQGVAWLVFDAAQDNYHCYWFVGPAHDHLVDHADAPSAAAAVEWARSRTPAARIRMADHRTYWAGTKPNPGGFAGTWTPAHPRPAPRPVEPSSRTPPGEALAHTA
jgi:hypothetical protein